MASEPKLIFADSNFMSAYYASIARQEWLDSGADWRRAKREARKVMNGSWRAYQAERLERMAGLYPSQGPIDPTPLTWWKGAGNG